MTLSVPNLKYFEDKKAPKAFRIRVNRNYQKFVHHTEYIILFNLYMVYRGYNALNLFFYHFLSNSFVSAKMLPMFESEELKGKLNKEVKELDELKSSKKSNASEMRKIQTKVERLEHLYKGNRPKPNNFLETKAVEKFADFYAKLRDAINNSGELQKIGCFNHTDWIESEGVRPWIVPMKEKGKYFCNFTVKL